MRLSFWTNLNIELDGLPILIHLILGEGEEQVVGEGQQPCRLFGHSLGADGGGVEVLDQALPQKGGDKRIKGDPVADLLVSWQLLAPALRLSLLFLVLLNLLGNSREK